jgi:hypothetical protein
MASTINADDGVVSGSAGVKTSADNSGVLELQSNGTTQFTLGSSSVVINEAGADVDFRVEGDTDSNLLFVDASTDRVGVGTNVPLAKFQVGNGTATTEIRIDADGGSGAGGFIRGYKDTSNASWYFGDLNPIAGGTNDGLCAYAYGANPFALYTNGLERLRVDSAGNVGIGTSSPAEKFEVEFNTNGYILADNSTDTNTGIKFANTGRTYGIFTDGGSGSSNSLRFYDFTAGAERLRLDSAGNLGLGVTPSAWDTTLSKAIQLNGGSLWGYSTSQVNLLQNAFYNNSGDLAYVNTAAASAYRQISGAHSWFTAASGTAGNTITFTQALSVGLGTSLALQGATSQSGTGITFPATQNASSNANTLDDYEEGTWTPTIVGSTNPVYGASIAQGKYTKIGSMVYVEFLIVITSVTSQGVGNIQISGMPFSSSSGSYQSNINFIYNDTWDVNMRNGYTAGTIIQPVPNSVTQSNIGWTAATLSTGYFSGAGWYIA